MSAYSKGIVQTTHKIYALNTEVETICFVFHTDDVISGEYFCSGIQNTFIIRYQCSVQDGQLVPLSSALFSPFPAHEAVFYQFFSSDYSPQVWNGLGKNHETINSLMCRRSISKGVSFYQWKLVAFHLPMCTWSYIIGHLSASNIQVHSYNRNYRKVIFEVRSDIQINICWKEVGSHKV